MLCHTKSESERISEGYVMACIRRQKPQADGAPNKPRGRRGKLGMLREQVVVAPKTGVIFGDAHEPPRPQCFSGAGAVKIHRGRFGGGKLGLAEGAVPSFDGCRPSKASAWGLWRIMESG